MTASLSRLPLLAGGALMSALGQAGLWGIARFARAPLASTGIVVMTTLSVMAASNALYFQKRHHPAPLFAPALEQRVANVEQPAQPAVAAPTQEQPAVIEPVLRTAAPAQPLPDFNALPQQQAAQPVSPQTTASTSQGAADSDGPVGNADVYAVQKKLAELKLLSGKIDGYYGPSTANAIRAFELSQGLTPQGALTPDIMKAILRAPVLNPASAPAREQITPSQQLARVAPAPTVTPTAAAVQAPPAPIEPAPVQVASADQSQLLGRVSDSGPERMLDTVGSSAAQSLDNLVNALGGENNDAPLQRQAGSASQASNRPAAMPPAAVASTAPRANTTGTPTTDQKVVSKVQRGLMSLGFLAGAVDGVPGESTARAIRNFEVYYNYKVTGQVTNELVGMLEQAGAVM